MVCAPLFTRDNNVPLLPVLSDPEKRARIDRGESLDEEGDEGGFAGEMDVAELFAMMFGGMGGMGGGFGGGDMFADMFGGMMDMDDEEVRGVGGRVLGALVTVCVWGVWEAVCGVLW